MAKKKPAPAESAPAKSVAKSAPKTATTKTPATKSTAADKSAAKPKAPATSGAPAISIEEIGHAAGAVWQALDGGGAMTLASLKKAAGVSGDMTLAGVGWLAREGKVEFKSEGRSVQVALAE